MNDGDDNIVNKSWLCVESKRFELHVRPLSWYIGFKDHIHNQGDWATHHIECLCFYLMVQTLTAQGRAGRKYRQQLKDAGEWNPEAPKDGHLHINQDKLK